jgi:hypothetical protein
MRQVENENTAGNVAFFDSVLLIHLMTAKHDILFQVLVHSIGYDTEGQGQIVEYDPAYLSRIGENHTAYNISVCAFSRRKHDKVRERQHIKNLRRNSPHLCLHEQVRFLIQGTLSCSVVLATVNQYRSERHLPDLA